MSLARGSVGGPKSSSSPGSTASVVSSSKAMLRGQMTVVSSSGEAERLRFSSSVSSVRTAAKAGDPPSSFCLFMRMTCPQPIAPNGQWVRRIRISLRRSSLAAHDISEVFIEPQQKGATTNERVRRS